MGEFKKTSRADLYASDSEPENGPGSEGAELLGYGNMDFEFVEIDNESNVEDQEIIIKEQVKTKAKNEERRASNSGGDEEYDFPLFGSKSNKVENQKDEEDEEVAFPLFGNTMKVSLKEDIEETLHQERPAEFYFASYSKAQESEFEIAAITYEEIEREAHIKHTDKAPWKVLDLALYNSKIDKLKALNEEKKRKMRKRPGKKKREMKISCTKRKEERAKVEKKIEKEQKAKLKKKMFHKRGGKKNKKKAVDPASSKPKYRTE
ncbi:hypothetical protein CLIB1423_01S05116 [[Candida] railenensis]|uniref:Uncharacterized protein n=1 Tax=[Candida] railenensis TaxID=45579 RepID=A0A9P0VVR8_9ASCO|nr:hypothetical protein CLIB1423_01S05116 [[Candida] railenensis]